MLSLLFLPNIDQYTRNRERINYRRNMDRDILNNRSVTSAWYEQIDRFFYRTTWHSFCERIRQEASRPIRDRYAIAYAPRHACLVHHVLTDIGSRLLILVIAGANVKLITNLSAYVHGKKHNNEIRDARYILQRFYRYVKLSFHFVKIFIKILLNKKNY